MGNSDALARYVELKQEIAALEKQLDELKSEVFTSVDSAGGKVDNEGYTLTSQKRPKYKFSDDYTAKDKELKAQKKQEIADGIAEIDGYSEFVTIKFKKS